MRFIIYGLGAIGGSLAVRLTHAGFDVVGIARGAQLEAVQAHGLTLRTPDETLSARVECVGQPNGITFTPDDVILLTMKTQHTEDALQDLRAAGVRSQTIVCMQNGVANERLALRHFPNVLGAVVMMPATYLTPGEVFCIGTPKNGLFDIGRYPSGPHRHVGAICEALNASGFAAFAHDDVMRGKYGKLLLNLANGIDTALGAAARDGKYANRARAEALAVYEAAGIAFDDVGMSNPRRQELLRDGDVPGLQRVGSSAAQSLQRGAGSVETDYLNGEIVLLGRLHGVPTPVNAFFTHLSARLAAEGAKPGSLSEAEVDVMFTRWQDEA